MRNVKYKEYAGRKNALRHTWVNRNWLVVVVQFLVIYTGGFLPSFRLKNFFYRLIGMKIGKGTAIGLMAMFDVFYPNRISIGRNCIIGYGSTILCHDVSVKKWGVGNVKIGNNVLIGANSTVLAGVSVGDNAVISAMTLVNKDVPANTMVGGVPAKIIKRVK